MCRTSIQYYDSFAAVLQAPQHLFIRLVWSWLTGFFSEIQLNVIAITSNEKPPFESLKVLLVKNHRRRWSHIALLLSTWIYRILSHVQMFIQTRLEPMNQSMNTIDDSLEKVAPMKYRCIKAIWGIDVSISNSRGLYMIPRYLSAWRFPLSIITIPNSVAALTNIILKIELASIASIAISPSTATPLSSFCPTKTWQTCWLNLVFTCHPWFLRSSHKRFVTGTVETRGDPYFWK